MNLRQRIRFYQQLAVLTRGGVPLRTGLQRLRERLHGRQIDLLAEKVAAGEPLGEAFAAARFSPFETNLAAAGERSAQLDTVFQHLADFWTRQREMYQALTGQLYYPLTVFALSLVVGALIELPFTPGYIVAIHLVESVAAYGAVGFVIYTLVRASWESDAAQRFWTLLPIVGKTLSSANAYRWITALRLEHSAGIPMPDAVADAWRASGYIGREDRAQEGQLALREGQELSSLVQKWRQLPRDWVDFIETGEVSGALETAFAHLEREAALGWNTAQKRMTEWVPKIIYFFALLVVGAQVFFVVYGLYQRQVAGPMNEINSILARDPVMTPFYDSDSALAQYLLFHYGTPEQICPLLPEMRAACGFPARCVTESLRRIELKHRGRALDLGCAVGRGSFELRRTFGEVTGIDFSRRFIEAARAMQAARGAEVSVPREGSGDDKFRLELPGDLPAGGVNFETGDACALRAGLGTFDLALLANLIDRLPDPARCLARMPELVRPGGWLVLTSPYTWLEEYTPRAQWLDGGGRGTLAALREILEPSFRLRETFDLPFLIREHRRKYQWSVAEASLWQRE